MQPTRSVRPFEVVSDYQPSGDQRQAIAELAALDDAPLARGARDELRQLAVAATDRVS